MIIIHSVIHGFDKDQQGPVMRVNNRPHLLDNTLAPVVDLVSGLKKILGNSANNQAWGRFGSDERIGTFPPALAKYVPHKDDAVKFLDLTHLIMKELIEAAGKSPLATGGRILFALLDADDAAPVDGGAAVKQAEPVFMIAMIKQKGGVLLDDNFVPIGIVGVDLSKLHQAAQIQLDHFMQVTIADGITVAAGNEIDEDIDRNYLSFLAPKSSNSAASYFIAALGCVLGMTPQKATKQIYVAVQAFFTANDVLKPFRKSAKEELQKYLKNQLDRGVPATLEDICTVMKNVAGLENVNLFDNVSEFLNGAQFKIPNEFSVHPGECKKNSKVTLSSERINLKFDRSELGEGDNANIKYNKNEKTLTINNLSDDFIAKLDETLIAG